MKRRQFLSSVAAGLVGAGIPALSRAATTPCMPPSLALDGGIETATTACAQVNAPAYIAGMAPFSVLAMTGSYAPTNGTSTLESVMPSMWLTGGDANDDIMRPWSGGPKLTNGSRLWVHGGGHADSRNNSIAYFDFAGSSAPTGWVMANGGNLNDTPVSVHTYGGMCEVNGSIYRFGGATYSNGNFTNQLWRFSISSGTWTAMASGPFATGGALIGNTTAGTSGKLLAIGRYGGAYTSYAFYDIASNSWTGENSAPNQWPSNPECAYRPTTSTTGTVLVGGGDGAFTAAVDWSAGTLSSQTSRSIGAVSSEDGPAVFYDPASDRYWALGGTSYDALLEINPSTYAVTSHPLTGTTLTNNESSGYVAHFGRFVFMPTFRAMGVVFSRVGSAFVIRLP